MARIHYVKAARKAQGSCSKCGKPINVGDPYKWTAPRASKASSGHKKKACSDCQFRASDTMSSPNLGAIADAVEDFEQEVGNASDADGLRSAASTLAEAIREVGQNYEESADNMEEGFGHATYMSDEIREKAEQCESWADEIESAGDDVDDFDEGDYREDFEWEVVQEMLDDAVAEERIDGYEILDTATETLQAVDLDLAEFERLVEEKLEEKADELLAEQCSELESAAGNQPF